MAGLIVCYALVARRLTHANFTAPMLSVAAGLVFFSASSVDINADFVHAMAEVTLVIILFHDASTVRISQLRRDAGIAFRLLAIGFPLALLATFLLAGSLLPALGAGGAWLIAAAITPTDAGLGAPTVLNPVVPLRVRRGLNVESGLNDGLATPSFWWRWGCWPSGKTRRSQGYWVSGWRRCCLRWAARSCWHGRRHGSWTAPADVSSVVGGDVRSPLCSCLRCCSALPN